MRFVVRTAPGVLELSWMWLPAFCGLNNQLKKHIEDQLKPLLEGQELTDDLLDAAHERVIEIICTHFPTIAGLRDYLDAVKFVDDVNPG